MHKHGDNERENSMEPTLSFGDWLRRRRRALDLTQVELAQRAACAVDTIKKIEADQRRPSKQLAERLADCLAVARAQRTAFLQAARAERTPDWLDPAPAAESNAEHDPGDPGSAAERAPPSATAFVGRERELATLQAHLAAALAGRGRTVFVTGEAGDGKTALLRELVRRLGAKPPLVASGACQAYAGVGDPYLPFRDVLLMLCGDLGAGLAVLPVTPERARRSVQAAPLVLEAVIDHGPDLVDVVVPGAALLRLAEQHAAGARLLPRLQSLLDRRPAESAYREQRQLFEQYTEVLRAVAARFPLLVVLDDLQWADTASIHLLFHLGRRLTGSPILIVGSYRISEVALGRTPAGDSGQLHPLRSVVNELVRHGGDDPIDLGHISPDEGRQLVDGLLDREPNRLSAQFRAALYAHTRGQPLFTIELLRAMRARGDLVRDADDRWIDRPMLAWAALPVRVEAVIRQRIERLEVRLRRLLEIAAVEGEEFTAQVVARVDGSDERAVLRELAAALAQGHGLIGERGELVAGGARVARFQWSHALFRQYLYNQLSSGERRLLHGEVAAALAELYEGQTDAILVQLAHHYSEAGDGQHAIPYLLRAGDRARSVYALKEAVNHYVRALEFMRARGDDEAVARTLMKLGLTYHLDFDLDRSRQVYAEAFALWRRVRSRDRAKAHPPAPHALRLVWQDPPSLDPTMGGYNLTAPILTQLFSGLVTQSPEMEIDPDLAQSWDVLDGGRTYVFYLRDDVYWSDGVPLTAADFEFTYKRALDPATAAPVAGMLLYAIKGASAFHQGRVPDASQVGVYTRDPATLVIELEEPASYFLEDLSYYVLLPVPRHVVAKHGAAWAEPQHIVSNGPFHLAGWQRGRSMVLERNPAYHGRFDGNVQRVELALGGDTAAHYALYDDERLDLVYNWFVPSVAIEPLRRRHPDEYACRPRFATLYLCFNVSKAPFDDVRVRRAFAMSIDREELANGLYQRFELPATGGFVPLGMPGYSPDIGSPYDPQQARALLVDAGYAGGSDVPDITLMAYPTRRSAATFVQAQWNKNLGAATTLFEATTSILEDMRRVQPSVAIGGWIADYADPDNFLRVCVHLDVPGWQHEPYEQLLEQARHTGDQALRIALYQQADRLLMQEAIIVPLCYAQLHIVAKPWVRHFTVPAIKHPGFWKDVVIEPHEDVANGDRPHQQP